MGMRTIQRSRLLKRMNELLNDGGDVTADESSHQASDQQELDAEPARKNWKRRFSVASNMEYYENVSTGKVQVAPPAAFGGEEAEETSEATAISNEPETLEDQLKASNLGHLTADILKDFDGDLESIPPEWMEGHCGRLQTSRLQTLIAKMGGNLWYTGSTAEYDWWKNATTQDMQYYAPKKSGSVCISIDDGYFKEEEAEDSAAAAGQWTEVKDPATGKTYFFNPTTKETSWTRPNPTEGEAAEQTAATRHWKKARLKLKMVAAFKKAGMK